MRRVCWDRELVQRLFTTEADTKLTQESFLRLHKPFDRIRVVSAKPYTFTPKDTVITGDDQFISERGLLSAIQAADLHSPNRIFVLTGEPGAGKSHLARWLFHMMEEDLHRYAIHIPRRVNTLVGVLKRLCEVAGLQLPDEPTTYLLDAPPMKVVRFVMAYLDMAIGAGTPAGQRMPILSRIIARSEMESILTIQVAKYQAARRSGTDDGTQFIVVPEEEFAHLAPGATLLERTEAYAALRNHLTDALRKLTNLDRFDLATEMARISQAFVAQGRRPVLILEDITSFDLLHDDLLTFLLDEVSGHFDALVCWTTGYEKAYLRTYQLDRYTARLSLSDVNMEVYALQNGGFRELVKGYLDAVKPWCKRGVCDLYDQCVPAFEGMYPLNPEALDRIYENLIGSDQQRRKTPRNLLDRAVKAYLELAEDHGTFPPIKQPAVVRDILYPSNLFMIRDSHPAFVAMAAWYGRADGGSLHLDPEIPRLLGVTVPAQYQVGHGIVVPLGTNGESDNESSQGPQYDHDNPITDVEHLNAAREEAQRLGYSNHLKELRLEVQAWTTTLKVPPHVQDLLRGVQKLLSLFKLRLPVTLGHPQGPLAGITFGKLQGESNLTVAGTRGKITPTLQFMLVPNDLVAMGREHEIWQAALELQVSGRLLEGTDIAFLSHWCHERHAAFREEVCSSLELALGVTIEEWAIAAKWTLLAARAGRTSPSYSELLASAETVVALPLDLTLSGIDRQELEKALLQLDAIVDGCFAVAKGVYDAPRVRRVLDKLSPPEFLRTLADVPHSKVDSDFRIGGTLLLRDLVRFVKHVAGLMMSEGDGTKTRVAEELSAIAAGLEANPTALITHMEDYRRLVGLTERYDLYDATTGQAWDQGRNVLVHAMNCLPEVKEVLALPAHDGWSTLQKAHRLASLRANPGISAAWAASITAKRLCGVLNLSQQGDPCRALADAIASLQLEVRRPVISITEAIAVLEAELTRRPSPGAVRAVKALRSVWLTGD